MAHKPSIPHITVVQDGTVWRILTRHSAHWIERSGPFEDEARAWAAALALGAHGSPREAEEGTP